MAAPTFVSSSSVSSQTTSTFSVTAPSGISDGNFLIAVQVTSLNAGPAPSTPSGWTLLRRVSFNTSGHDLAVYYKIAASEPGSYTFNNAGAPALMPDSSVVILCFSGAATTVDGHTGQSSDSVMTIGPGSYTTTQNDCVCVVCWAINANAGTTISPLEGTSVGPIGGSAAKADCTYKTKTTAGLVTNTTATLSSSQNAASIIVAIPPPPPPSDAFFSTPPLAIRCM